LIGADNGSIYLFQVAVCGRRIDLTPFGFTTVTSLTSLDTHLYAGGSNGLVAILNSANGRYDPLHILSVLPTQQPPPQLTVLGTPTTRPSTPSRLSPNPNNTPRPRSATPNSMRRKSGSSISNPIHAAGGKSSQPPPSISRKGRAKGIGNAWKGPGDRPDETLPVGVKASTDVQGIILIPVLVFF
jgi:hypothetical protein